MAFNDFIKEEEQVYAEFYKNWRQYTSRYPFLTSIVQAYNTMDEYCHIGRTSVDFNDMMLWIMIDAEQAMREGKIPTISDDKPLDKLEAYLAYHEPIRQKNY